MAGRNQYLETLVALLNERKEQAELPSLRQALKLHLRRTKAGRTAYSLWSYARLLKPVRSEPKILRPKVIHEVKAVASNRSAIKSATASAVSPRTRKALLLVTTEGTDMPYGRFLLDLIDALKEERQIWVLHMGEGPLIDRFEGAADNFVSLPAARFDYSLARDQIKDLLVAAGGFELAIVAGKESRSVLPPLTEAYVPSLALLHEPDVYATSVFTFQEIFFLGYAHLFHISRGARPSETHLRLLEPSRGFRSDPGSR